MLLLTTTLFQLSCCTYPILHWLILYTMLRVPYSAMPHFKYYVECSLFHNTQFNIQCSIWNLQFSIQNEAVRNIENYKEGYKEVHNREHTAWNMIRGSKEYRMYSMAYGIWRCEIRNIQYCILNKAVRNR